MEDVHTFITNHPDSRIVLLRNKEVVQWLFGDLSFLPPIEKKNKTSDEVKYKALEDKWGQEMLKTRRPDLKLDKQWTNRFGEYICEEILMLMGKTVTKPENKHNHQPDSEVEDGIWEAKAGTYHTSGTAHEKILGCPHKYRNVPVLYGKPLYILCIGEAERICKEKYGNLDGEYCDERALMFRDFHKKLGIQYVAAADLLKQLVGL
jgi:hypothetical protein